MKIRAITLLVLVIFHGVFSASAGYSNDRLGIEGIPIGGEKAEKIGLDLARSLGVDYPPIKESLPEATLTLLRTKGCFAACPDNAAVMGKIVEIREMVLTAIEGIGYEDPHLAECLQQLYRAGRICLGFSQGRAVAASINNDASEECGNEPINIYKFPCGKVALYDFSFFELANSLAHEVLHASQHHYSGPRPRSQDERAQALLIRQCNEVDASAAELERIDALDAALTGIQNDGQLPDQARGLAGLIGGSIMQDASLTAAQRRAAARDLRAQLQTLRRKAQVTLECRTAYKRALEIFLAGGPNRTRIYNDAIRETGWFQTTAIRNLPEFGSFQIDYMAGGGSFVPEPDGEGDSFVPNREFQQFREDGEFRTFTIPGLESVSDVFLYPGGSRAVIAGTKGNGDGVILGAHDADEDGFYTAELILSILEGPELGGGLRFVWNSEAEQLLGVNRRTGSIFNFGMIAVGTDMFPSSAAPYGSMGYRGDLQEYWLGPDHITLYGAPDLGAPLEFWDEYATARFHADEMTFIPGSPLRPFDELKYRPAFGQLPLVGDSYLRASGRPGALLDLSMRMPPSGEREVIASEKASYTGMAAFKLDSPLAAAGYVLEIAEQDAPAMTSVEQEVQPEPPLRIGLPPMVKKVPENPLPRISITGHPFTAILVMISHNLVDWFPYRRSHLGAYGGGMVAIDPPQLPIEEPTFFSILSELEAEPTPANDSFTIPPGVRLDASVIGNDVFPPGSAFVLQQPPAIHSDLFTWSNDGSFSIAPLTVGPASFSFTYYIRTPDGTQTAPATVTITVNGEMLSGLVPVPGADGIDYVEVPALDFGDPFAGSVYYPIYQFRLANNPQDVCQKPHWHASGRVYHLFHPILGLDETGLQDPNPPSCGFGTYTEVPQVIVPLPAAAWAAFQDAHPSP